MATSTDFYEVLGVPRDATQEQVKQAFRRLAMEFHPDRNKAEGAEERFKAIAAAYEVLSDAEKRSAYDRFGAAGVKGNGQQGFAGFEHFGGFGDIFDAFFRGTGARPAAAQRGADLRAQLDLSFEEAVFGAEREIEYERTEACEDCRGRGQAGAKPLAECRECGGTGEVRRVQQSLFGQFVNIASCGRCGGEGRAVTDPCATCRGRGQRRVTRRRAVKIPAGVDDGAQIRVSGEGDAGARGGPPGSLYVVLAVHPHAQFARQDNDLVYELPLNIAQAALGATVQIPTLDGMDVPLEVMAGTQPGQVFRLRGRGVPYLRGSGRGDLLVLTRVVTPQQLSAEQRALLEQLAASLGTPSVAQADGSLFDRIRDAFTS